MASTPPTETPAETSSSSAEATSLVKRYQTLLTIRTKAVKGRKGAWYWTRLEPILLKDPDTNLPKAVKLKCSLCDAVFSASNPSRTASEHLKRGTCPNFNFNITTTNHDNSHNNYPVLSPTPISSSPPPKRRRLTLSGGEKDLGPLAKLEDSVRRIQSLKKPPLPPLLGTDQITFAIDLLSDWVYETCGSVSFSSLQHPKFRSFLNQVGLPVLSRKELLCDRLEAKFSEAKADVEGRIREANFFQLACSGGDGDGDGDLIKFSVNFPSGDRVFRNVVSSAGGLVVEEMIWEEVIGSCGNGLERCVGIVSDKCCKVKELRNIEVRCKWMVNLSCQVQGFVSLIKDFSKELPVFRTVSENCLKVANFVNGECRVRSTFRKHRMQELGFGGLIRVPWSKCGCRDYLPVYLIMEDVLSCAHVLQMVVLDDSCKALCVEDPIAREVAGMIQRKGFWSELEAVYSLVKMIRGMTQEIEDERPVIGQCLHLWKELRAQVKDWCVRFNVDEGLVEQIIEKRYRKNYHPAWSAAFVLDPLYLMRDSNGKYLPPFNCLTQEQEKDVNDLIIRTASKEEAHLALMELMKWRSEGLDPLYAQAVQIRERDHLTGKMKVANPQGSRLVWETCLSEYKTLGKVAVRLIFLHATSFGFKCNSSFVHWLSVHRCSMSGLERVQKMLFIAGHAKLERQDLSNELEDKDEELLCMADCEKDILNDVLADAPAK